MLHKSLAGAPSLGRDRDYIDGGGGNHMDSNSCAFTYMVYFEDAINDPQQWIFLTYDVKKRQEKPVSFCVLLNIKHRTTHNALHFFTCTVLFTLRLKAL